MLGEDSRISIADLSAAGVRLRASEAVTIVRELIQQVARGSVPGVPSAHVIRLLPTGQITVEGPVAAGRAVSRAATLLDTLLPPFDASPEFRAPGALRLVIARALGTMDLPPYNSLQEFASAMERFGEPDAALTVQRLTATWARAATAASEAPTAAPQTGPQSPRTSRDTEQGITASALVRRDPASLTISDIRRARRATGLPLAQISTRCRIPVPLLRQLEWGYFDNWPTGLYGRTQLVRYARAWGLDEQIVTSIVWPVLEQLERERAAPLQAERAPAIEAEVVEVEAGEVTPAVEEPEIVRDFGEVPVAADVPLVTDVPLHEVPLEGVATEEDVEQQPASSRRTWKFARAAVLATAAAAVTVLTIPDLQDGRELSNWRAALSGSAPTTADRAVDTTTAANRTDVTLPAEQGQEPQSVPDMGAPPPAAPGNDATTAAAARPANLVTGEPAGVVPEAVPAEGLSSGETAWSPAFATVGSAMFYHTQDGRAGPSALVRADTDGEGAVLRITRVVDDNSQNFHARPSPDGSQIAFDSDRDGERAVYVADADGANVRRISGDGFAAVPSWSPDGRTLAFVRAEPDRPRVWNLWLADLDTGDLRRLTSYQYGQPWGASWFPDGRRVAYSHEERLVVLDIESGREREYASPRKGRLVRTPAVSPDGSRIIFQLYRDGAWLLDLEDGSMRKVLADPSAEEYAWSPDGRRVAYHSRQSGEWGVWLMLDR